MLKKHLPEIRGRLFVYFSELYTNMYTLSGNEGIDYEELGERVKDVMGAIFAIRTVSDLDQFCEEWGLNEIESEFSFLNIVKKYSDLAKK